MSNGCTQTVTSLDAKVFPVWRTDRTASKLQRLTGIYSMVTVVKQVHINRIKDRLFSSEKKLQCYCCDETYQLRYSKDEANRLMVWLAKAQTVVNQSHADSHCAVSLPVPW
jgi:hypothetical protein